MPPNPLLSGHIIYYGHYTPTKPTTMLVENLFKALNYASLEKYTKDSRYFSVNN